MDAKASTIPTGDLKSLSDALRIAARSKVSLYDSRRSKQRFARCFAALLEVDGK
jgi:hypothetical protein